MELTAALMLVQASLGAGDRSETSFAPLRSGVAAHALSLPEGLFRPDWVMAREREAITEPVLPRSRSMM